MRGFTLDKEGRNPVYPVRNETPLLCSPANGGIRSQNDFGVV
jgi:hypothetical protein